MAWVYLVLAGFFELAFAVSLKLSEDNFQEESEVDFPLSYFNASSL